MSTRKDSTQVFRMTALVGLAAVAASLLIAGSARAGTRKFLVILATSPKQYPGPDRDPRGQPTGGLINRQLIDNQYFDTTPNNNIGSFAEYWEEISYGDVTITGRVVDWIALPWPIQPPLINIASDNPDTGPPDGSIDDPVLRISPANYYDLNDNNVYNYGAGEPFDNTFPMVVVDLDGDPGGTDNGPFFPPPKVGDVSQGGKDAGRKVWMPGERFVDVDEDGKWDGLDETNNWMDWYDNEHPELFPPEPDGRPDLAGPWIDLNENGEADNDGDCFYLPDSDNDGNPDCCPNGPGKPGCDPFPAEGACRPEQWQGPGDAEILDCNGNTVPDACDISCVSDECLATEWIGPCGESEDTRPYVDGVDDSGQDACVPGDGDGVPDECQYVGVNRGKCFDETIECDNPEALGPCCMSSYSVCQSLVGDDIPTPDASRCEYPDDTRYGGNGDGELDIVEPFENFLRRWEPCLFDPDVQSPNVETQRAHWIKVFDPNSVNANMELACTDPVYSITYRDDSYIRDNYPGNPEIVIAQATGRPIYGQHDPLRKLFTCDGGFDDGDRCASDDDCDSGTCATLPRCDGGTNDGDRCESDGDCNWGMCVEPCICAIGVSGRVGERCRDFDIDGNGTIDPDTEINVCLAGWHDAYDPPDKWTNVTSDRGPSGTVVYSTKMQAAGGGGWRSSFITSTPKPGTYPRNQDTGWYEQAWNDRYNVAGNTSTPPAWPRGFDEDAVPIPGGPPAGAPVQNTLKMIPFVDADEESYDPEVHRRFFSANRGGLNGRGVGWIGADLGDLFWETGPLGEFGFEEANDHPILPEESDEASSVAIFYDGWVEHDDLPSSKYHMAGDQRLGEITSPYRTWAAIDGTPIDYLDPAIGVWIGNDDEPRRIPMIWGGDHGDHNPGTPSMQGDHIIPAAGPYAIRTHGDLGRDAGNLLLMELLTWRTEAPFNNGFVWEHWYGPRHPFAGPGPGGDGGDNENLGFRDYNLDGLLDQGEVRPAGSENYLSDCFSGTSNTGTNTGLPFNRQRLLEDCIEVLDDGGLDFDDWVDPVSMARIMCPSGAPIGRQLPVQYLLENTGGTGSPLEDFAIGAGVCSGIVLLPDGAHVGGDFPIAPSFYPIHNEDGLGDPHFMDANFPRDPTPQISWNLFFHDLVISVGISGESDAVSTSGFQTAYSAHEYLHSWEGFPDLYDYDVFSGGVENCPVGFWDIMANGGLVHPTPILKAVPCTEWIDPVDLTTVLTPGVDTLLTLPPAEFVRDDSYFFLQNPSAPAERIYLWSAGSGFDDVSAPAGGFPGEGVLVLHTDLTPPCNSDADCPDGIVCDNGFCEGANPDARPLQQRTGIRPTYRIVQADARDDLNLCDNRGDDGDPWPGSTGNTVFDCSTNPPSRWYCLECCTGLSILDVQPDGAGSALLTLNWAPTSIPSLRFIDPPGGESVQNPYGNIYQVQAEATDVYGGTWLRFFHTTEETDVSIDPDGANFVGMKRKTARGTNLHTIAWNIADVPDDHYFLFAELIPGPGADGTEAAVTTPRPGRNNVGDGTLSVSDVDTNRVVASGGFGRLVTSTSVTAIDELGDPLDFQAAGARVGDQLMIDLALDTPSSVTFPALRTVTSITSGGFVLNFDVPIQPPATPVFGAVQVTQGSDHAARSETWTAVCVDADGEEWQVNSNLSQPAPSDDDPQDPYPRASTGVAYTSVGGEVTFTITAGATPFALGDTFAFTTTGITAASRGITIRYNQINENPVAIIIASPLAGTAPLSVSFDARDSFDPDGLPLGYRWTFGDGSTNAFGPVVSHQFVESGTFTVLLTVTNPQPLSGEAQVDIHVINNSPNAVISATPLSGPTPLDVSFNGAMSSDLETPPDELIYEWDFGDGDGGGTGNPGDLINTTHFYSVEGEFHAMLTVTDSGGQQDVDTVTILVGNTRPVPNITYTPLDGADPWEVVYKAINSYDADDDELCVTWIWGDGTDDEEWLVLGKGNPCDDDAGAGGATDGAVPHTYRLPAGETASSFHTYAIVTDERGASATWPGVTVIVSEASLGPSDPRAVFSIDPDPPELNDPFTVDATLSFDRPAGDLIDSYTWDFDDGTFDTGTFEEVGIVAHTYTAGGTYTIRLTVADAEDPPNTHTTSRTVILTDPSGPGGPPTSTNDPPTAILVANSGLSNPFEGFAGETEFTFDARSSTDPDGDDDALTYQWAFGDGGSEAGALVTHVFNEVGTFLVRLSVRDEQNASTEATQAITILVASGNHAPVANIATGPRTGTVPVTLRFDGRTSYDQDGDLLEYIWEFKLNGVVIDTLTGPTVSRTFDTPGTYVVELIVSDGRGGESRSEPEIVEVTARVVADGDLDLGREPEAGQDVTRDSADQRPSGFCGFGMLLSLFGTWLGLSATAVVRRRYSP